MNRIRRFRFVPLIEMLQLQFDTGERIGVEQLSQLRFADELAELGWTDGAGLGAAPDQRCVAFLQEVRPVL